MIPFEPVFEHVRREPDNQIENHPSPAAGQYNRMWRMHPRTCELKLSRPKEIYFGLKRKLFLIIQVKSRELFDRGHKPGLPRFIVHRPYPTVP